MHTYEERSKMRRLLVEWGSYVEKSASIQRSIDKLQETIDSALDIRQRRPDAGEPTGSAVGDGVARKAERHMRLNAMYEEQIQKMSVELDTLMRLSAVIEEEVSRLGRNEQSVLRLKYDKHYTYSEIARKMWYTQIWVKKLEQRAVDKLLDRVRFEPTVY